jgi:hypothetical protein
VLELAHRIVRSEGEDAGAGAGADGDVGRLRESTRREAARIDPTGRAMVIIGVTLCSRQ